MSRELSVGASSIVQELVAAVRPAGGSAEVEGPFDQFPQGEVRDQRLLPERAGRRCRSRASPRSSGPVRPTGRRRDRA
jgi:hypothetical protein